MYSIIFFSSFTSSFKNSSSNFNAIFLYVGFGSGFNNFGSNFFSKFFIGSNLFLKLLIAFSLAVKNNPMLHRINFFSIDFIPLSILFNLLANFLCSSSTSFNDIYSSCISLKKTIGKK